MKSWTQNHKSNSNDETNALYSLILPPFVDVYNMQFDLNSIICHSTSRSTIIMMGGRYQVTTDFHWMVKSVILFYLFFNQILNSWSQQTFEIGSAFPKAWSAEPSGFLVCTSASTTVTTVMECPCKPHHSPTRSLQFFTAGDAHAKHQWETQHTVQHIWHCSWIPSCRSYCSQICRISTWSYSAF